MISAEEIKALMEPDTRPKDDPSFYEKDDFVPALSTLQTLLNQAAEALGTCKCYYMNDETEDEQRYNATLVKTALAAIQPYLTKEANQ